ncbi:MAG: hypothetical protein M1839_002015 [Geoglossum umbratile]|nr:MAG: hypothetical protein M1839_002015 [Geoglossum umbratile]
MAKNIESSFRKTGLVPFNPATVLQQLPVTPLIPSKPVAPPQLQTPPNVQDLEKMQQILGDSDTTPNRIAKKALKTAITLLAENLILHKENKNLLAHNSRKQAKVSKTRKRIPIEGSATIGEELVLEERLRRRGPARKVKQQQYWNWSLSENENDEKDLEGKVDSNMNSCIIKSHHNLCT